MSELTKHLPLQSYDGSILSALGKGLTVADAHHDLSPAEAHAVIAEIVRRVNLHYELVEALRLALLGIDVAAQKGGREFVAYAFTGDKCRAILAKVDAAKGGLI